MSDASGILSIMDIMLTSVVAVVCVAAGALAGWFAAAARHATADARAGNALAVRLARAEAENAALRESADRQSRSFRDALDRARDDATARDERDRREQAVLTALAPVRETLHAMQQKVSDIERDRQAQYGTLSEQLRRAHEAGESLRATTETLAGALRSNSTRGVWGETQLRSVVEAAGLLHRVDFDVQTGIEGVGGPVRPDMIVHLPGGTHIAVDAKVPFSAYLEASAIPATAVGEDAARREALLRRHVKALRDHISALGSKAYWTGLDAGPELVIAFIPSEGLVSAALETDPTIMEFAFSKRVAIASPVTLWSVLKTVAFSWQQQTLGEDAKRLFEASRELYGRLGVAASHLDKLGRSLRASVADYNRYIGSMERQVLPSARRLAAVDDATALPSFVPIEVVPRELTAEEFVEGIDEVRRRIDDERVDAVPPTIEPENERR